MSIAKRMRSASCSARHPIDAAEEAQVLLDREIAVERKFLRHVADMLPHAFGIARHVEAGHHGAAAAGRSRPQRMRMMVDLPAPLGPRKPMISPRAMRKLMWSTATNLPKRLTRFSATT